MDSQSSNDAAGAINSQNYTSDYNATSSDADADDFVFQKVTWKITEIDVSGAYFNGSCPASPSTLFFYKDNAGTPENPVERGSFKHLLGSDETENLQSRFPQKV